jgi:hypothetical protein
VWSLVSDGSSWARVNRACWYSVSFHSHISIELWAYCRETTQRRPQATDAYFHGTADHSATIASLGP